MNLNNTSHFHKFSVVIPSLNQARYLRAAIESLINQGYPELEVIVIDGGSTDGSISILESFGKRINWVSEQDDSQSDAINKGFSIASGEWLGWLNSDDVLLESALHHVNDLICKNPDISVVVGNGMFINENGEFLSEYPTIEVDEDHFVLDQLFEKGYLAQPSTFFQSDAYFKLGGLDIELEFAMDYDLWIRLAKSEGTFLRTQRNLSGNRWYEGTKTTTNLLELLSEVVKIQLREFGKVSPYFVQAISDNLYSRFHSSVRGDKSHILFRSLYFKAVWIWLNYANPLYCLMGLVTKNISKSGPIVGDELTLNEMLTAAFKKFKRDDKVQR